MRVAVAMSGGVDSSVAALLLHQAGHEVHGVFMKNYEPPPGSNQPCPWEADQADVATVCAHIGIPWESWNFEEQYARQVLAYFFREYQAGRTPNPDVMCNREVKFGVFLQRALSLGYDCIATGHYARIQRGPTGWTLLTGVDEAKDQSYFLHTMTQEMLAKTLFPIGGYEKSVVRRLARDAHLPNAAKPDSQGICFIGKVDVAQFLRSTIHAKPGPVRTADGEEVGEHSGLPYYTIGQRHGLGVGGGVPFYVARKDLATNALIVARGDRDPLLYASALEATNPHWIAGTPQELPLQCRARIRYRQRREACTVRVHGDNLKVAFDQPQRAITPGQSIVFYQGDQCLGGAVIERAVDV